MALANNHREQMAKKLKADLQLLAADLACKLSDDAGDPLIELKSGSTVVALLKIQRRKFDGFQMLAELSSDSAQGLPEHECWVAIRDTMAHDRFAKISKAAFGIGASSLKLVVKNGADPASSDLVEANVTAEIPNSARLGAVGQ
jgi:hypothetical protein